MSKKYAFLFCSDPLNSNKVDPMYQNEYVVARLQHECLLVSFEDLQNKKLLLKGALSDKSIQIIYRGWMLKPEIYDYLYQALKEKNMMLINTPDQYKKYHLLPGWYHDFEKETPKSCWIEGTDIDEITKIAQKLFGPYVVKDYVKSLKHYWKDAAFIKDIGDQKEVKRVVTNFIRFQGDQLLGGIVLRKYEPLKFIGYHPESGMPLSEEYRVFVLQNQIININNYWKTDAKKSLTDEEWDWITKIGENICSNFITIDLARKKDGSLIIMEMGDGQVSGLQELSADQFYQSIEATEKL